MKVFTFMLRRRHLDVKLMNKKKSVKLIFGLHKKIIYAIKKFLITTMI
jgi:hypothetical protein